MKYPMLSHRGIPFFVYPRKDAKNVLYYRFEHGEDNYHKSSKTTSRKEAILKAQEAIDKILDSKASVSPTEVDGSLIIAQVVSEYLGSRNTVLRPSTRRTIALVFRRFTEAMGTLKIDEISIPLFHGFLNETFAKLDPEPSYWRDNLTRYNQFWRWCIVTRKVSYNPMEGYPRPKTAEYRVYDTLVEESEFNLLCAHLGYEDELAVRCFRYMGIYPQDWAFAIWDNFSMKDGVLTFYRKRGKNHLKFNQPLDGRIEPTIKAIWLTKGPGERMFCEVPEKGYKSWYCLFERRLRELWLRLGFKKHKKIGAFRHTFASEAVDRGVPEDVLLSWMGYHQGSTVLRRVYVHRKSTARYRFVPDVLHHGTG